MARILSALALLGLLLAPPAGTAPTRNNNNSNNNTLPEPPHSVSMHRVFDIDAVDVEYHGAGPELGDVSLTAGRRLPTHRVTDPAHGYTHDHGVGNATAMVEAPGGHGKRGGRDELPDDNACGRWYKVFFYQWIVQLPPEWWVRR